ncbi:MAG: SdiA-regulated domain-containing protein, partial [Pirellulales bacterium]
TNSLFIVDDDAGKDNDDGTIKGLYEYSLDGTFQRAIALVGFNAPKSIVYLDGDSFAIMEEVDFGSPATKEIAIVTITATTTTIDKSSVRTIVLTGPKQLFDGGNSEGPEGLAYDPNGGPNGDGVFYVAKEKDDPRLFEVILDQNMNATAVNEIVVPDITGSQAEQDLSDIFFADGDLFVVSDEAQRIFRIDLATKTVIGPDISDLPQRKFEGLSFTPDGFQMFVVSDKGKGATPRRYLQYRNFTVFNPTAPDLASSSDLGASTTDTITNDATPTFTGTVPADSTVWVYVDGVQVGDPDPLTGGASAYSITLPAIAGGTRAITIKVGESESTPESKRSPASPALNITIDTAVPRIEPVAFSGSGSANAPFSPDVQNPDIGTGGQVETIPVGSADQIQIGFTEDVGIAAESGQALKEQVGPDGVIFSTTNDQTGGSATLAPRQMLAAFALTDYELNLDLLLDNPEQSAQLEATDFSGVTYSTDTNSLFIVDDDAGKDNDDGAIKGLYEYSLDGTFQRAIELVGFNSPESIVHLDGNSFAIMEEVDIKSPLRKEITLVTITAATTQINKSSQSTIVLTGPDELFEGGGNAGPEGLAYDPNGGPNGDGVFYVAKEKDDPRLFEVILDQNMNATAVNEIVVPDITGPQATQDLSDIFFADGDLFAVSDEAQRIFRIDLATQTVIGPDISDLPQRKFEGLSFTPDGFQMFVVSDSGGDATPRRYLQYRNFTVFNPTAPDLASGSDLGVSTTDNITNDPTPTFTGTVPADSTVWVYVDGVQVGDPDPLTGGASAYSITLPAIADGNYAITIKVGGSESTPESKRSPASPVLNITIDTAAPRIERVAFSGSGSVHALFSLEAQNPDIGTGGQLKTIPVGSADQVQIGFTEDVGIAAGSGQTLKEQLSLDGVIFGATNDQSGSSATLDATVADAPLWTFANVFGPDQYILSVQDAIIDIAGNQLDGEWTNPDTVYDGTSPAKNATATISSLPSGTGVAGGNFDLRFVVLPGDANRDNVVGVTDATIMDTFGPETSPTTDSTFQRGDIDGDGDITNAVDYATLIDPNVFGSVLVASNLQLLLGDLDINLKVDFDDIDAFVTALDIAFSDYLATYRGSFNGYEDTVITQIVQDAIGDIDDNGRLDFDDIDDFAALLQGISGSNGELLPPRLT